MRHQLSDGHRNITLNDLPTFNGMLANTLFPYRQGTEQEVRAT